MPKKEYISSVYLVTTAIVLCFLFLLSLVRTGGESNQRIFEKAIEQFTWSIYISKRASFSFAYPDGWPISTSSNTIINQDDYVDFVSFNVRPGFGRGVIGFISVTKAADNESIYTLVKQTETGYKRKTFEERRGAGEQVPIIRYTTIAGNDAVFIFTEQTVLDREGGRYVFFHNNYRYMVYYSRDALTAFEKGGDKTRTMYTLKRIVDSIRLVD